MSTANFAWVSVDEDDPLPRFLACLGAAFEPHDLPWRVAPDALPTLAQAGRGLAVYELHKGGPREIDPAPKGFEALTQ